VRLRTRHRVAGQAIFVVRPRAFFRRFRHGYFLAALGFGFEVRNLKSVEEAQLDGYVFID